MLYTIVLFISGIYLNQEYPDYFPSIKILLENLLIYIRNLGNPVENIANVGVQAPTIFERIIGMFWR